MKVLAVLGLAVALMSGCGGTTTTQPEQTSAVTTSPSSPALTAEAAPASVTPSNVKISTTPVPTLDAATQAAIRAAVSAAVKKAPKPVPMQIRYVYDSVEFSPETGTPGVGYAACPKGYRVTGGGFKMYTPSDYETYSIIYSRPRGDKGWEALAYRESSNDGPYGGRTMPVPTYAICVK